MCVRRTTYNMPPIRILKHDTMYQWLVYHENGHLYTSVRKLSFKYAFQKRQQCKVAINIIRLYFYCVLKQLYKKNMVSGKHSTNNETLYHNFPV